MLDDARAIIECESPSHDLKAVAKSADVVAGVVGRRLRSVGLDAEPERLVIDGVTHLRWRWGGPTRIVLLGHHDTVWPHGSLETHPCSVGAGVMRGPGCFDMAIGIVQAVHAVTELARREGPGAADGVTLLITGDEEVGSVTSRALLEETAADARAVLVFEASGPRGALKTERKGTSMYTVSAHGRAAHAGLEPENGVNAGLELAYQLQAVADLDGSADGTTVVPTSGTIGSTVNTVPALASFGVDVRARTRAELERIDARIRGLEAKLPGASVTVEGGINRPPLEYAMAAPLFKRAVRLASAAGIEDLAECAVGGASDGNFTAGLGIPTLDGLGGVGGGAHADDEHVLIEHVPHRTALVALLIADLLGDRAEKA